MLAIFKLKNDLNFINVFKLKKKIFFLKINFFYILIRKNKKNKTVE